MKTIPDRTKILCAGPGLGFYVPGVVLSRQLSRQGHVAGVDVFEGLFIKEKSDNIPRAKERFHQNFSFARMAQGLAKDPSPFLDADKLRVLFFGWDRDGITKFVLLSGFWIPVMELYVSERPDKAITVLLCHLDAANSTSWDLFPLTPAGFKHLWLCN